MNKPDALTEEQKARQYAANKIINEYPNLPRPVCDVITLIVTKADTLEAGEKQARDVAIEVTRAREAAAPHYRAALREVMK